ncbi:LysR family transcriptional regulator [Paroceanicella profunda]|uniref:LysR family transcriptional regulator n=1 Tax=Paroceanicella profunda TaxID=2579971 RepID=A0A5B8G1F3_9RHOB|nr:LysR substrate-binding domain-containing protein [Paroceanicella profunda]QDL92902.1 LysR family transcriptional regulator [Paroceanicella profunda]
MNITLRQLRYLMALMDEGHFGRAAEACSVSQPALSVQIRDLEANLGAKLVERHTREVRMTPMGREVARRARRILDEVAEIEQRARWDKGLAGQLALGLIPTVAPYLLPLALPRLRARNLRLDLGIREATTHHLLGELREGRLDAAVVALPAGEDDLVELPLFEDRFLLAASRARAEDLSAEHVRPEHIDPEQLLLLDEGHCLTDQALEVCSINRRSLRTDLRAASLSTLSRLVEGGFGMTLLPEISLWVETAAAPNLAVLRFAAPEPSRTIGLVRRRLSVDDGWFTDLGDTLRASAAEALERSGVERIAAMKHGMI